MAYLRNSHQYLFKIEPFNLKTNSKNINAVISIDMNNLKELNDEYRHDAGDTALKEIVYAINKS